MQQYAGITTGRFAPTPSGPLHFGSLVTAVASYCQAKSVNGTWLVRMEDLDTPRVINGAADNILKTLEHYGFEWEGEVIFQSHRFDIYQEYLEQLIAQDLVYGCSCSRKTIQEHPHRTGSLGMIYPGFCRHKKFNLQKLKLRLNTKPAGKIEFFDRHYGTIKRDMDSEIGDIILKRQDGIFAYHLAVVIDDAFQQVNEIVRGADLIDATCIHIYLNQLFDFSTAEYLHVPLILNENGEKLSKQSGAKGLDLKEKGKSLVQALNFLGQKIPLELSSYVPADILNYAISNWDGSKIPK